MSIYILISFVRFVSLFKLNPDISDLQECDFSNTSPDRMIITPFYDKYTVRDTKLSSGDNVVTSASSASFAIGGEHFVHTDLG